MATIFKHNATSQTIRAGKSWRDENGILHPPTWNLWSAEEKTAAGITEVVEETPPDSRLYTWSQNADGTINKTAKSLDDVNTVDKDGNPVLDGDGKQHVTKGVKSSLKEAVNSQQGLLLDQTDWYIIRKADKGTAIPSNVQTWRDAIRTKGDAMKSAIDSAANTAAIEALFVVYDSEGNKSGVLYDWPVLET